MADYMAVSDDYDASVRPWTAEIDTMLGAKCKYNLPTQGAASPNLEQSIQKGKVAAGAVVRSPGTRAAKELWASQAPKGVDYVREKEAVPKDDAPKRVPMGGVTLVQGFIETRHPKFGKRDL